MHKGKGFGVFNSEIDFFSRVWPGSVVPQDCEAVAPLGEIHKVSVNCNQGSPYTRPSKVALGRLLKIQIPRVVLIVCSLGYDPVCCSLPIAMAKTRTPRKQKRRSLASKDHFARLIREAMLPDPGTSSSSQGEPSSSSDSKKKMVPTTVTLNYANVLVIERFQAAVESRTSTCQRLEQLIRTSPTYTPAVRNQLISCLKDDFIRGDKTRRIIEDLRRSDFISTLPSDEDIEYMRKDIAESTRILLEGSKELQVIGDHIAAQFS